MRCLQAKSGQRAGELEDAIRGPDVFSKAGDEMFSREIGSSLQRLRKEGKIRVEKAHWYLSDLVRCPLCDGKGMVRDKTKAAGTKATTPWKPGRSATGMVPRKKRG